MAKRAMRAAGFWPRHTVQAATRVLRGSTRDRYRQEFLAELYGLGRTRQLRHAAGVLSRCWTLRAAINTPSEAAAADMEIVFPRRRRPLFLPAEHAPPVGNLPRRGRQPVSAMPALRQRRDRRVRRHQIRRRL
jgi:hypothetical protein